MDYIVEPINEILSKINFEPSDPQLIGYEFRQNENFWTICIHIKRNRILDFSDLEFFLHHPMIKLQCLSIGSKYEGTKNEFIYTFGLYKCYVNPYTLGIKLIGKEIGANPNNRNKYLHLANSISLCCRRISSSWTATIIANYVYCPEWIHDNRRDQNYKESLNQIKADIFYGKKLYENQRHFY